MTNRRLSRGLCAVVGDIVRGSHPTLDALFMSAGAPGDPPNLAHHSKWKEWLFRAGQTENTDSLNVLGNVLEEFMDSPPSNSELKTSWGEKRQTVIDALFADGLSYYRGGRVIPNGEQQTQDNYPKLTIPNIKPSSIEEVLSVVCKGLPRAMYPLTNRRKNSTALTFNSEYDIQDLLHALLRPWVSDIRAEEFAPSYAGSSTRMDFLLPAHNLVIETKIARDRAHGKRIGEELILDIDHYRTHPACSTLWCVIYDPHHFIANSAALSDLEGESQNNKGRIRTKVIVIST